MEKRGRGRPKMAFDQRRVAIKVSIAPDVHDALAATGNASRTIDELVRLYLITTTVPAEPAPEPLGE